MIIGPLMIMMIDITLPIIPFFLPHVRVNNGAKVLSKYFRNDDDDKFLEK